jgi:hypothetical protein
MTSWLCACETADVTGISSGCPMIKCRDSSLTDGAFEKRARDAVRRHMEDGESIGARRVLSELGVKRVSQGRARRLAAQEIVKVYTKRVPDWAVEHPEIRQYVRTMSTRADRARALQTVANLGSEQLPGVDFGAVRWQVIVDALGRASNERKHRPGSGPLVASSIALTLAAVELLELPWLKIAGGGALLYIGTKLLVPARGHGPVPGHHQRLRGHARLDGGRADRLGSCDGGFQPPRRLAASRSSHRPGQHRHRSRCWRALRLRREQGTDWARPRRRSPRALSRGAVGWMTARTGARHGKHPVAFPYA